MNIFSLLLSSLKKKLHLFFGTHKIFKKKDCSFRVGFRVSDSLKKKLSTFCEHVKVVIFILFLYEEIEKMSCTSSSFNAQQRNASVVQNAFASSSSSSKAATYRKRPMMSTRFSGGGGAHRIDGDAIFPSNAGLVQRGTNRCLMSRARRTSRNTNVKVEAKAGTANDGGKERHQQKFALLFDCDGVLVETEELHRLAYNASFAHFGVQLEPGVQMEWTPSYYDVLANTVGGGKPKMRWHFKENTWPTVTKSDKYGTGMVTDEGIQDQLIDDLQDKKTEFYKKIVEEVATARGGILELMDEAIARPDVAVGICSAATKAGFEKVVNSVVGKARLDKLDVLMAGDDVTKKKPDPLIYNLAREKVDLPADMCVVIEDSIVGLRAAQGAGMPCIITPCGSTLGQDFESEGAKFVCDTTVEDSGVTLSKIFPGDCEKPCFDF